MDYPSLQRGRANLSRDGSNLRSRRRGDPVRNTVAPVPIVPLVAPAAPVPTASTAIAHQLIERCRSKLDLRRVAPNRGRLRRGREGETDGECKDQRAHFCLIQELAQHCWLTPANKS